MWIVLGSGDQIKKLKRYAREKEAI